MSERTKPEPGGHAWPSPASGVSSPRTSDAYPRVSSEIPLPPPHRPTPKRRRTVMAFTLGLVVLAGVAGVILATRADPDPSPSAPPTAESEVPKVEPPARLKADPAAFRILLRWEGSDGTVSLYKITRNGDVVATLPAGRTRWLDTGVFPTSHYRYAVRAVDADGVLSGPTTIAVRTPSAPLALARVQGVYDVTMINESDFGYSTFPARQNTGWRFVPVCEEGSCDVDWRDINAHDFTAQLNRTGATYSGSDEGRYNIECGGHSVESTLTFQLHVTRAKVVGDTWRATVLEGDLTQREGQQLGCRASGVDFTVRLVLYP
jgi:hypothetical protein